MRRVGDELERDVDIRVVAATNRDLHREVQQGNFREDLFFRLNVLPIHMPALRQRPEDIPEIAAQLMRKWGLTENRISPACMKYLQRLPLPGNVRELENLLQRMIALSDGGELDEGLLREVCVQPLPQGTISLAMLEAYPGLDAMMEHIEKTMLEQALQQCDGNMTRAAELLGLSFRSIRYRMQKLGLKVSDE